LDLNPSIKRRKLNSIDVELHAKVGYWVSFNHLQEYKIYETVTKMFCSEFLNNLQQPLGNNPWPTHPTNKIYKM
jgi:hypothetical protein